MKLESDMGCQDHHLQHELSYPHIYLAQRQISNIDRLIGNILPEGQSL
jgi:hypothetical protein